MEQTEGTDDETAVQLHKRRGVQFSATSVKITFYIYVTWLGSIDHKFSIGHKFIAEEYFSFAISKSKKGTTFVILSYYMKLLE